MKKTGLFLILVLGCSGVVQADGIDLSRLYIGTGLSVNKLDGFDNATGYQVYAGYDLNYPIGAVTTSIEVGYMDSGEFDLILSGLPLPPPSTQAKGSWISANLSYPINDAFNLLVRGGYDFGNDDGLLLGTGVEYNMSEQYRIRGEFVSRDEIDSFQINLAYSLK